MVMQLSDRPIQSLISADDVVGFYRAYAKVDLLVKATLFKQGKDKSSGPDDYFMLLLGFNATTIFLVPKILIPNQVKGFRPIS
ncbi:hypothetical protein V6N13_025372 [Hibiscus sabdariffa]